MSASHARAAFAPEQHVFARIYGHTGMVSLDGEKMSKSLGNLVFVNRLLADGVDPMAIRLVLLAQHYRSDWAWTNASLTEAQARLGRWRAALARAAGSGNADPAAGAAVLAGVRAAMAADLDAPKALAVVDRWAGAILAGGAGGAGGVSSAGGAGGAELVRLSVDALLGVRL
jgi:L-cysteine:1D-myo-inositol 2-amino-2-deoxy-alpha-D-glucopyranoside ligase